MANSNALTWVLLAGAAYVAYEYFLAPASTVTTGGGSGTPPVTTPPATTPVVAYVPPTQAQQLQTAAGSGVTVLNADQWGYYWSQLGLPAVDGTQWNNVFFPNGRPASGAAAPTMTAAAYVAALQGAGLAGYRRGMGALHIAVPFVRHGGRGFGAHYDLGDLRRAGGR